MVKFTTVEVKPENRPKLTSSLPQYMKIMAEHYDYDYAELHILNCGKCNQTTIQGYCLVKDGEPVNDIPNWKSDMELINKIYTFERKHDFIERTMSLHEYVNRYVL